MLEQISNFILEQSSYSKAKSDKHGEVFTPPSLINEMLDQLPQELFSDPSKTWFDPAAGKGNFPIEILKRLVANGIDYKHALENQIYMAEFQRESAHIINQAFNPHNDVKLNLYVGNTLEMPDDFFDLTFEERREKYPDNCL